MNDKKIKRLARVVILCERSKRITKLTELIQTKTMIDRLEKNLEWLKFNYKLAQEIELTENELLMLGGIYE